MYALGKLSITHKDAWNLLETNQEMLNDVKIL